MKVVHIESSLENQMLSYCESFSLKKVSFKRKICVEGEKENEIKNKKNI